MAKKHHRGGDFINLGNILLFGLVFGIEMGQMEDNFPQEFFGFQLQIPRISVLTGHLYSMICVRMIFVFINQEKWTSSSICIPG